MNGPDHFRAAEEDLTKAALAPEERDERYHLASAQVHATLALAAATAEKDSVEGPGRGSATGITADEANAWVKAGVTNPYPDPVIKGGA